MATPIYITPSTTFVKIDEFQLRTQSPFTTVVLSTVAYQGQTVTILDRSGLAQAARPIVLSTALDVSFYDLTFSTLIDQPKGFLTVQSDGSVWSRLNTFPFWNQAISSGVSFLNVSTLYTSINSTTVESANYLDVENIVITGRFPPTNTAAVVRDLTILDHSELLSSVVAWTPVYLSSFLSTFSSFTIVSSLSVTGPIIVQSTLRTLSSINVSTSAFTISLSTAFINILGNIRASTIDVQQSTAGPSVNLGGSITFQQNLSLFSSLNTGGAITGTTLSVGSTLSTVGTLAVGNSLFISTNVSTGTLFQRGPLVITGSASVYGTVQASSMSAYSLVAKNGLFLDNSLQISSASIQNIRTLGTLSSGGQTVALSYFSTLQALDIQFMTASSTRATVQGSFSTVGSLLVNSQFTELSSIYLQGYLSTASTVTVGKNALFQGPVLITGSIVFTSSLTFLSSLNVLNTLSINTAFTNVSTSIVGNLFAYSTVTVTGLVTLSSISLNNRAIVNEIVTISSFITPGYLSTPQVNYSGQQVYTSSLGIGFPSTSYTFQAYNALSSQILLVSSLVSTSQVISDGFVQTSTSMTIGMNSLGQGLDVGGLAKINGSINAFQTISSQGLYASTIYGTLYGNAMGLSNFPVQDMVSTSRIFVSTVIASNVSTSFFMASTGVAFAPLTIASTLNIQGFPFIVNNNGSIQGTTTNRIQAYPRQFLQLNNSMFVSSGIVGVNISTPKFTLHVEKTLGVGGIAGAPFTYRNVNYDTLTMSTMTNTGSVSYISSGVLTTSNLVVDSSPTGNVSLPNTNRIKTSQSTLNVNNFMYIGPSTVGIGVSSPNYTLDAYSLLTTSTLTTYTSEVNASIQVNPTEKSTWVATGPTNYITTSNMRYSLDDGNTWLPGDDLQNWNLTRGSAYNGSYWVSPGTPIMTSPDGVTWTPIDNLGGSGSFLTGGGKVAWNGSYWVATGPSSNKEGTLLKSTDGINWTSSLSGGFTTGSVYQGSDILWTGSQWIATGLALSATPISSIQWSQDGLNWSSITSGGFLTGGNGLSFGPKIPYTIGFERYQGNSLLFAVGNDSSISSIQYTYDGGYNWSTITSGGFSINGNGIDTDGRYLIAAGKDGSTENNIQIGSIQTNPFTISFQSYTTFTGTSIPDFTDSGNCVKWNGSEWLLGGNNGLRKLIPTSNSYFSSFTIGGTYIKRNIIAIERGATSFPLYTLDGGSTWTYAPPLYVGFSNSLIETNGAGKWVMVGKSAPASWYSTDGINWNQITNIPLVYPSQQAQDLRFLNNKWFIAANDSTNNYSTFMTSEDGINWSNNLTTVSTIGRSNVVTILYGNGLYVAAAGQYPRPYYSYDLVTWTVGSGDFLAGGLYGSVGAYGNGVFLMAGFSKYSASYVSPGESSAENPTHPVVRSTDGITWTFINATAFGYTTTSWINIVSITHSPTLNRFILGGFGTGIFYSANGSTWFSCSGVPSGSGGSGLSYLGSAWTGDQFIISPYIADATNYPFYFSSDGITFVRGPFFSQLSYNNYGVRGFITTDTNDQTEYTSFAYSSNQVPSLTTSSFSILANSDLNTLDSQLLQNSMAIQSNTIVLNDIFTVTDKVVNIGYHPLNQTIANQSSLYIFHNLEITGSLSTGSASISSLYLGIQSV